MSTFKRIAGEDLVFISRIKRDGSGVEDVTKNDMEFCKNDRFELNYLSMTERTFIASGFNSYVVRLK